MLQKITPRRRYGASLLYSGLLHNAAWGDFFIFIFPQRKMRFIAEKLKVGYYGDSKDATFWKGRIKSVVIA